MLHRLFLVFIISLSSQTTTAKILVATVAQVKKHVITSREVAIHKIVNKNIKAGHLNFLASEAMEQVIREWLLYYEASSFYNSKISSTKVNTQMAKLKPILAKDPTWRKLSVTDKELRQKLERFLEAERLFVFKKKASVLPVSLAEIETEYAQNRVRYGNLKFEEVKEKIRKNKFEENMRFRLGQWFEVLERKYKVQRFTQVSQ